ncbi:hypothetical protein HY932_02630 [Candidatus Falkowbacteria bacterium]|nr:hypothetical protein [Candidatus Falkowbacteria bacterium]
MREKMGDGTPKEQLEHEQKSPLDQIKSPEDKSFTWSDFLYEDGRPKLYSGVAGASVQLSICHEDGNKICLDLEYNNANEGNDFYKQIFDEASEDMERFLKEVEAKATSVGWEVVSFNYFSQKWMDEDKKRQGEAVKAGLAHYKKMKIRVGDGPEEEINVFCAFPPEPEQK